MAGLLAGLPDSSGGVTLNRLCGSGLDAVAHGGALDPVGRGRADHRRRQRKHEPRAVRHAQGDRARSTAQPKSTTPPSAGASSIRRCATPMATTRCRARPRMSPTSSTSAARTRTASPQASQERAAAAQAIGPLRRRNRRGRDPAAQGRPGRSSTRDEHPRLTSLDALAKLQADRAQGRHRHRRQCLGRQRRRRRADHRLGGSGQAPRPDPARANPRRRGRRRAAAHHGHRPRAGSRRNCSSGSA